MIFYRANRLVEHKGIPKDEIHIKIGGDAGGGSFKMAFQIANVDKPNSKTNTVIFTIFKGKDTWANLWTALQRYQTQIKELSNSFWW